MPACYQSVPYLKGYNATSWLFELYSGYPNFRDGGYVSLSKQICSFNYTVTLFPDKWRCIDQCLLQKSSREWVVAKIIQRVSSCTNHPERKLANVSSCANHPKWKLAHEGGGYGGDSRFTVNEVQMCRSQMRLTHIWLPCAIGLQCQNKLLNVSATRVTMHIIPRT